MSVNWSRLYESGRCKAVGVPWNADEAYAALNLRIPAKYVREGILTVEEYEKVKKEEEPKKGKEELFNEAKEMGSTVVPSASTEALEKEIEDLRAKAKEKGVKGVHLYKTKESLEKAISK